MEAGALSSLGVKGDVYVAGNSVFGKADTESYLEIHSLVEGRFPLSLAEATNPKAHVTIRSLPPPPAPPSSPVCPRGLVSKLCCTFPPAQRARSDGRLVHTPARRIWYHNHHGVAAGTDSEKYSLQCRVK